MLIGLHDAEFDHMPHKTFPNYALMKISTYFKRQGHTVEWWNPDKKYGVVFSSKVFSFTPDTPKLPRNTLKGGTGYGLYKNLPSCVDNEYPDYSLYPDCDYAVGFITRGCPNNCDWCVVPKKEGCIRAYRHYETLVRQDTNKLVLMDNNILASDFGTRELERLTDTKFILDLNQGMDIRLVTPEIVQLIKRLKWQRFIRFSCDSVSQLPYFEKVIGWFKQYGVAVSRIFVYLLVRQDLYDADYRVQSLNKMSKSINLYAQAERNIGIVPDRKQLIFAQRYVYRKLYRHETWIDYCIRQQL